MSTALSAGVTGLQAHQRMLDVAGNNIANVNTTAYKSSTVKFSELFSQTMASASGPTASTGGTNPQQVGSGVGVASIMRNNTQGTIVKTGNPFDAAIDGEGYFVLNDGEQNVYTRSGTFGVDADSYLVDTSTGYRVQRTGTTGEADNFQTTGNSGINIPYSTTIQPSGTSEITLSGNLSSDQSLDTTQTQLLNSNTTLTTDGTTKAISTTSLSALYGFNDGSLTNATITISGKDHSGNDISGTLNIADASATGTTDTTTTVGDLITAINTALGSTATAELSDGKIKITDATSGYSQLDVSLAFANEGTSTYNAGTLPAYFEYTTVGGTEVKDVNIAIYDHQGSKYNMTGSFVRTNTANQWDFVLSSLTGSSNAVVEGISIDGRRVSGITFNEDTGAYAGLSSSTETAAFSIDFGADAGAQTISLNLGTENQFVGITQVAGSSTAVATDQDGYTVGSLSSVTINSQGNLVGTFSNGIRKNIASLAIALFSNPLGLETPGKGLYSESGNSGTAKVGRAQESGAGSVQGSALEKSNSDVAQEFVNLITAQNGYQANARTISVANDIMRELSNLVR